jgi:integrase
MQSLSIKIPHISWREGRPRFNPGPKVRALRIPPQDLKHASGEWFSAEEAMAWVRDKAGEIAERRAAKAEGRRLEPAKRPGTYSLADMFADLWRSPKVTGGVLAPATVYDYRQKAGALLAFAPELGRRDVRSITKPELFTLHERLWQAKGLAMANGILAVTRIAFAYAERRGKVTSNPAKGLGLEGLAPRLRVGTLAEMQALVVAADAIGESMVGTAIILGLFTGQRQADRLALEEAGHEGGWLRFVQRKTGAIVEVPAAPMLLERLATAARLRAAARASGAIVVDHRTRAPFTQDAYGKRFARVRAEAALACPSVADFRDQDLRDTAVTWLARAGATLGQIRSITGHDPESVTRILKHYLAIDREQAAGGIAKLVTYLEDKGAVL